MSRVKKPRGAAVLIDLMRVQFQQLQNIDQLRQTFTARLYFHFRIKGGALDEDLMRGAFDKGVIRAEYEINEDRWFFPCHFEGDPIMPGCLGLDGMWQLVGFYLGWMGAKGKGRAIGVGNLRFSGMVTPKVKLLEYEIDLKRVINRKIVMLTADGVLKADGEPIYKAEDLRVVVEGAA